MQDLVEDVTAILQSSLETMTSEQQKNLYDKFEAVIRAKYDEWLLMRAKPAIWYNIKPMTMCKVIIHKIAHE